MIKGRSALDSVLEHGITIANKPVVANTSPVEAVANKPRGKAGQYMDKAKRREYMRTYMAKKRAEKAG